MNTHNQGYYRQQTPGSFYGADSIGSAPAAPYAPAAPSSGGSSGLLSNFSMNDIKGFIDRMGGVEGILSTVGKVQKFAQTFSQFAPMVKLLIPKLGASNNDDDDYSYRPRRRRRRRGGRSGGRSSYGGYRPRRRRSRYTHGRYTANYGGRSGGYDRSKRRTSSARRRRSGY